MATAPAIHHWLAGDEVNSSRLAEIASNIEFLRNPPTVRVGRLLSNQTIPINVWTTVTFDTVYNSYDPWGFYNAATPTLVTAAVAGWYMVEGVLHWASNVTDARIAMSIWKQDSELILRWDQQGLPSTGGNTSIRKEVCMFLNIGDTVQLKAFVSAGSRDLVAGGFSEAPILRLRWVSN